MFARECILIFRSLFRWEREPEKEKPRKMKNIPSLQNKIRADMVSLGVGVDLDWHIAGDPISARNAICR